MAALGTAGPQVRALLALRARTLRFFANKARCALSPLINLYPCFVIKAEEELRRAQEERWQRDGGRSRGMAATRLCTQCITLAQKPVLHPAGFQGAQTRGGRSCRVSVSGGS